MCARLEPPPECHQCRGRLQSAPVPQAGAWPPGPSLVNLHCVSWHITGPCVCNPMTPCVQVAYWEPGWLVETVKRPGTTTLPGLGDLLTVALDAAGVPPLGGGGAGNATGSGHTNLQYNEVHVYTFPQLLGGPCTGCAPGAAPFTLHYASETDPLLAHGRGDAVSPQRPPADRRLGTPLPAWGQGHPQQRTRRQRHCRRAGDGHCAPTGRHATPCRCACGPPAHGEHQPLLSARQPAARPPAFPPARPRCCGSTGR